MDQATPAVRNLARRLLAWEADRNEHADSEAHDVLRVFEKMRSYLSKLVGVGGVQVLLTRSLALGKPEASWLRALRVDAEARLEGFDEAVQQLPPEAIMEGSVALLAQLFGLLFAFIGEALTLRLVVDVWPEAQLEENYLSAEGDAA